MIELIDVCFSYEGRTALKEINLEIKQGESVSLLGPNGSGKSTLLKLFNGIIFADQGIYKFGGEEINQKKLEDSAYSKSFHQKIGFVFQNPDTQLFCPSVYDEIAFGPRQMGLTEDEVALRVHDCLALLKLEEFSSRQPYHLSEGEKRKVAIACVLSLNPQVLILDEPMDGLDPRTQRSLLSLLLKLSEAGKTLISSTHNLELVQELSRRAVLFDETHRIVADLPSAEILEDIDLLKRVNLVDEYYHMHEGSGHKHFHVHNY